MEAHVDQDWARKSQRVLVCGEEELTWPRVISCNLDWGSPGRILSEDGYIVLRNKLTANRLTGPRSKLRKSPAAIPMAGEHK